MNVRRYFEKSTFGACAAPGVWSSKYSGGPSLIV
jgi:hypothetical protein